MSKASIKKLILIFLLSFALNLIWENAHAMLYVLPSGAPLTEMMLLRATLFDAIFTTILAVPFIVSQWFSRRLWLALPVGIIVSVVIELEALATGKWAYAVAMSLVPLLHTGLTPTVQLGILAYATYKMLQIDQFMP